MTLKETLIDFIENDDFECEAIDITDNELSEAVYTYNKIRNGEYVILGIGTEPEIPEILFFQSATITSNDFFDTPKSLFSKHIVEPEITEDKVVSLTKKRKQNFSKNTVFEYPKEFVKVLLTNDQDKSSFIHGIAGRKLVKTFEVVKDSVNYLGYLRPFFRSKTQNHHFDMKLCSTRRKSLDEAIKDLNV